MRIRISHETRYRYDAPTNGVIQTLRLTPRNHDGQYVIRWRIDVTEDCRLDVHEDAFGNITHTFTAEGPFTELALHVEGEVDVQNTAGIVSGAIERFPPSLYLRATPLTEEQIKEFYIQGHADSVKPDGHPEGLLIETPDVPYGTPDAFPKQVYIWSNKTFEGNIYVEFEWKTLKRGGLSLLMIQASGMTREDFMADYPKKTSGIMQTVHEENVRNYH